MKTNRSPYSWAGRPWRTADLFTPLIGAAVCWLLVAVFHVLVFPWWGVLGVDVLVMLTALRACAGLRYAESTRAYTLGFAFAAALFMLWGSFDMAWAAHATRTTIIGLVGTAAAVIAWPLTRRQQIYWEEYQYARGVLKDGGVVVVDPAAAAVVDEDADADREFWQDLFAECSLKGWECKRIRDTEAGIAVRMRAPAGARLTRALGREFAESLESHLDVRAGAVRLERLRTKQGASSRELWVHVDYEDILAKIIPMPDDHHEISINHAFPVGKLADGRTFCLRLRDVHSMIIGATRKGKSNLVHVIIHQLTRCYDASVWIGDLKGGATAKPWLRAWLEGLTDRPILGWVGIDRFEIERMIRAAIDIAAARPLRRRLGDKTEPARAGKPMADGTIATRDVIAIVLIIEEMAETVGAHAGPQSALERKGQTGAGFNKLLTSISTTGAGEAVYAIFVSQRDTNSMFATGDAKVQIGNRIAVGPMIAQDAASLFPSRPSAAANVVNFTHPGSIQPMIEGVAEDLPGKSFFPGTGRAFDEWVLASTIAHTPIVPDIEQDTVACAIANQYGFADRWDDPERFGWASITEDDVDQLRKWVGKPYIHHDQQPTPAPAQRTSSTPAAAPAQQQEKEDNVVTGFWGRTPRPADIPPAPAAPPLSQHQQRVNRVVEIIDGTGAHGITPGEIAAKLIDEGILTESSRTQVYRYIKAAMEDGGVADAGLKVERPGGQGTNVRCYTHRHVAANAASTSSTSSSAPAA